MKPQNVNRGEFRGPATRVSGTYQGAAVSELVNGITKSRTGVKSVLKGYSFGRLHNRAFYYGLTVLAFSGRCSTPARAPGGHRICLRRAVSTLSTAGLQHGLSIAWRPKRCMRCGPGGFSQGVSERRIFPGAQ